MFVLFSTEIEIIRALDLDNQKFNYKQGTHIVVLMIADNMANKG